MVGFGQDVCQPARQHIARAQVLPVAVHRKVFVDQFRDAHALHLGDHQGKVIHTFSRYGQFFVHALGLSYFFKSFQKMSEPRVIIPNTHDN